MQHPGPAALALCLVTAVTWTSRARADGVADAGVCARCHEAQPALAAEAGGHAPFLDCIVCHEDRRPNRFGHGHRAIPTSCTAHHKTAVETHPAPPRARRPSRERRRCLACHDAHGSTNSHLVRTAIRRGGRLRPIDFQDAGGAVSGGFVDPAAPGRGLCEVCHRDTRYYRADGRGESHFTEDCALCHDHGASFGPVITDASCATCHADEAERLSRPGLHQQKFGGTCSSCHAEASPDPGPGHRATSACADCHSRERVATHVPPGRAIPCTQCHEPHGSDNVRLVRDVVHTFQGHDQPVEFERLTGRADGSFASESEPGTGLCEICHTRTRFYRADGGGEPHYAETCVQCHSHAAGFAPR
jgi:predicted CXXCH cytochrome family protein